MAKVYSVNFQVYVVVPDYFADESQIRELASEYVGGVERTETPLGVTVADCDPEVEIVADSSKPELNGHYGVGQELLKQYSN